MKNMLCGAALAAAVSSIAHGAVIAQWTFNTAAPTGTSIPTGSDYIYNITGTAEAGAQTAGSQLGFRHASSSAQATTPAGNGSQYSLSSTFWAAGDYYYFTVNTSNYTNVAISFDQARSATGPVTFFIDATTDGGNTYQLVKNDYDVLQSGGGGAPGTWATGTPRQAIYLVSSAASLADNQTSVTFRIIAKSNAGATNGTNRIDNVTVEGTFVPTPGSLALAGLGGLMAARRRR
jgi:hypothetical protein